MRMNISRNNGPELIDVTTHTQKPMMAFLSALYSDAEADSDTDGDWEV